MQELDNEWAPIVAKRDRGIQYPLSNTSEKDLAPLIFLHKRTTHPLPAAEVSPAMSVSAGQADAAQKESFDVKHLKISQLPPQKQRCQKEL